MWAATDWRAGEWGADVRRGVAHKRIAVVISVVMNNLILRVQAIVIKRWELARRWGRTLRPSWERATVITMCQCGFISQRVIIAATRHLRARPIVVRLRVEVY